MKFGVFALVSCLAIFVPTQSRGAAPASGQEPAARPYNLVLITIDTLRADYVSAYGSKKVKTPNLDKLAREGVLFQNAYCQAPLTPPSHASILTGQYPATHGLRDFTSGPLSSGTTTLTTILKKSGYDTAAFVSAFVLDSSWGLDQGFNLYFDDFDLQDFQGVNPGNVQRPAEETINRALSWLPKAKSPFFLWVHLFDPHHDYNPPPPFRQQYASDFYAGEVAYVDAELGKLISALLKQEQYANSLIIATSDHGESLGEHGEREHGFFLYETTVRIPLIIKMPAAYARYKKRIEAVAQTIDILPTALQALRIAQGKGWNVEGRGLLGSILEKNGSAPGSQRFAYAETLYPRSTFGWSDLRVYREGRYKFIDAPRAELYDLATDPGENRNLLRSNQSLANQLRLKLRGLEAKFGRPQSRDRKGAATSDSEKIEGLGALGYVALGQPVPLRNQKNLVDPKDKISIFNQILQGLQLGEAGKLQSSNSILQTVAAANPELFIVQYSIGTNYLKLGQPQQALSAFEKARRLNPFFDLIDLNSARALAGQGRVHEAIEILQKLLRANPAHLSAQRQLALWLTRQKNFSEAAQIYQDILKRRPDDKQATKFLGITLIEMQKYAEGLKILSAARALGIEDAMTLNSSGIALANLGRIVEAIACYRKALELKPGYDQARLNLSFTLLKSGDAAEARKEFELLCRTNPTLCRQYESSFR